MVRTSFTARPQAEIDAATKLREEEKQRQRNRYRVVCKNTFEPGEGGDLVLAGTQGDLMGCSEDDLRVAEATFTVICTDPASHVESCTFDRTVWGEADAMLQFSIDYGLDARVVRVEE